MPRPKGSRDANHAAKRAAILTGLRPHLLGGGSHEVSFSAMATLAGVSIPTLRHYFPRRSDVVAGLLEQVGEEGKPYLQWIAKDDGGDLRTTITSVGRFLAEGLKRDEVTRAHSFGLNEGLGDATAGPSYLNSVLEPTLQAVESRLASLTRRGAMKEGDLRFAALNLVTPILVAFLHQDRLGGDCVRPMDRERLVLQQVETIVAMYGDEGNEPVNPGGAGR